MQATVAAALVVDAPQAAPAAAAIMTAATLTVSPVTAASVAAAPQPLLLP